MNNELTDKQKSIIERVSKLMEVRTDRGATEEEQANAVNLAAKLMEAHNLDMSNIERAGAKSDGKRQDKKKSGGLYQWQRDLWAAIAELNFCMHQSIRGTARGAKYEHRVIGRTENVLATELMAHYVEDAINRLAKEYVRSRFPQGTSVFIAEAIGYREGLAYNVARRVRLLRQEREQESRRKEAEARAAAKHPSAAPGTGLVLASVVQNEADLNNDFIRGWEPGTTQRRREEGEERYKEWQAKWEAERAEAQRADHEWQERDPEGYEAAKKAKEEEERKATERYEKAQARKEARRKTTPSARYKPYTEKDRARDQGYRDGDRIGLDPQIDEEERKALS